MRRAIWGLFLAISTLHGQQYAFVHVTAPGAPAQVTALTEDRAGRLWVGSATGVAAFDGTRFQDLAPAGFPKAEVFGLAADAGGDVWIASAAGLFHYGGGRLSRVLTTSTSSVVAVAPGLLLASSGAARSALADHTEIYRVQQHGEEWAAIPLAGLTTVGTLSRNADGTIAVPSDTAWLEFTPGAIAAWKPGAPLPPVTHPVAGVNIDLAFRDLAGCEWYRNAGITAYRCPGEPALTRLSPLVAGGGRPIAMTADGQMLLPGPSTLAFGRPGRFQIARPMNGLPLVDVAFETSDGTIWLGSADGLHRFGHPFQLEYWTQRDGLAGVLSVARLAGTVFAGDEEGVKFLSRDRRIWAMLPKWPEYGAVPHLLPAPGGTLYAAPYYHAFTHIRADGSPVHTAPPGLIPGERLGVDRDGSIWVAALGVSRVRFRGSRSEVAKEPLPWEQSNGLDMEHSPDTGDLWSCYSAGLIHRVSATWRMVYTEKDGLLQSGCRSLALQRGGALWYGYLTLPAFSLVEPQRSGPPTIRHYRSGGEVGDARIHFLDFDHRGWLWRGGGDGVYVSEPAAAREGHWQRLDAADGLPFVDTNQQAFYEDADGSVWIGLSNSVVHFAPPGDLLRGGPARIFVSAFSWPGEAPHFTTGAVHAPSGADVTAHVGCLRGTDRWRLRLRYRVLPEQREWTESRDLDLRCARPGWGAHTLEVQGRYGDGAWSAVEARPFTVERPVWASDAGLGAESGLAGAALLALVAWRRRRRARAARMLPDLTELRLAALIPEAQELIGRRLDGRFEPLRLAARGGFGTVFEGTDHTDGTRCAIKVFRRELADDWLTRRFHQEVAALQAVSNEHVVRIVAHGATPSGAPYLVMEYVEGRTLRAVLRDGALPPQRTAAIVRQAGLALAAIHARNIYHRDLTPDNLMLRDGVPPDRDLVLIDFSIAIVKDPDQTMHGLSRAAGTLHYMAPEQAVGYAESSTDIYSLAKVVIEMITGSSVAELLPDAALDLPQRVRELLDGVPVRLGAETLDTIAAALSFDPKNRPSDAQAFAEVVARALERTEGPSFD